MAPPGSQQANTDLENGQLKIYRGAPNNPEVVLWESDRPKPIGPFKLGITGAKRLVKTATSKSDI